MLIPPQTETPYQRGYRHAKEGRSGPPIPGGNATWADRLYNRGWCDAVRKAALLSKLGAN